MGLYCLRCSTPSDGHKLCRKCRHNDWLTKHADSLEQLIVQGLSANQAIQIVKEANKKKLNCYSCGGELSPATNGTAYFCTTNKRCRSARNRMKYLMYGRHKLTKETALRQVLEELEGE